MKQKSSVLKKTSLILIALASTPLITTASIMSDNSDIERFGAIANDKDLIMSIVGLEAKGAIPKLDYSKSLIGIDSDGDGIRDDLSSFADQQYLISEQNKAVKQFYKHTNRIFKVNDNNIDELRNYAIDLDRSKLCIQKHFGSELTTPLYKTLILYWGNTTSRQQFATDFITKHNQASYGDIPKLEPHFSGCEWEDEETKRIIEEKKKQKKKYK